MKTTKILNIEYKPDYFFTDMTNINDFDPKLLLINEITTFNSGFEISYLKLVIVRKIMYHTLLLITQSAFLGKVASINIECFVRQNKIRKC